jgi:hypothetical protein
MPRLTLHFKDRQLAVFPIVPGDTLIGRDPQCGIVIDSLAVAERHARIRFTGDTAEIEVLDAEQPLYLYDQPVLRHRLADGDSLRIGKHTLRYAQVGDLDVPRAIGPERSGWLQVLAGSELGRSFPLDRSPFHLGEGGRGRAMIVLRGADYHLSALEGAVSLNEVTFTATDRLLVEGDVIGVDVQRWQFFLPVAPGVTSGTRRYSRVAFLAAARLMGATGEWLVEVLDLSLKGALIARPADWPGDADGIYRLALALDGGDSAIVMQVRIARQDSQRLGLACAQIDLDSLERLRRLLELNLGDATLVERELEQLAG